MQAIRAILGEQLGWLENRCRYEARRRFGAAGAEREDDLLQESVRLFLHHAERGFFDEQARVALAAQVRFLLKHCLLQALTSATRQQRRAEESLESHAHPATPGELHLVESIDERRRREALRTAALDLRVPGRRLVLLALVYPGEVEARHFHEAARGGGLVREPEEAWALFSAHRLSPGDDTAWKRTVAEILRSDAPMGLVDRQRLLAMVNAVEVTFGRAAKDLARQFEASGETPC